MIDLTKAAEAASTLEGLTKVKLPGDIEVESDNSYVEVAVGTAAVGLAIFAANKIFNNSNKS